MPRLTLDVKGEKLENKLVPEGWYRFKIYRVPEIKIGKESGNKYLEWCIEIVDGNFAGVALKICTTLDKGDDPHKNKRFFFHNMMLALGIPKADDKYSFLLEEMENREFYGKVIIESKLYKGEPQEKNQIKQVSSELPKPKPQETTPDPIFKDQEEEIPF